MHQKAGGENLQKKKNSSGKRLIPPAIIYHNEAATDMSRTMTYIFSIDAALTLFHNSPPRMVVSELEMDVVSPESCFQAGTGEECLSNLLTCAQNKCWKKGTSVVSVVRRIWQTTIDDDLVQEYSHLGTFNLFTMIQGEYHARARSKIR